MNEKLKPNGFILNLYVILLKIYQLLVQVQYQIIVILKFKNH